MSTPFQKAFPGADENTVFEVVEHSKHYIIGDEVKLCDDDGTEIPLFTKEGKDFNIGIHLSDIRIKEPQLKKGDRCLVSDYEGDGDSWSEAAYVCNLENTFGIKGEYKHLVLLDDSEQEATSWKYAKPLPQTQTVTLQDGTVLNLLNDAVEKLREEYA